MTRIIVRKLIWDEWNREHIKKHNVSQQEIEDVSKNVIAHEGTKQGRYLIIGRVGSRILTVIINRKETGIYYPVTARDAAKKERRKIYEKEKKQIA
ncbi:BrnT family toxin [Candidatus Daviesbacteria bacterium]|nr:BrnT family toxin [Candidatus Daviesbacteria bacterium]